MLKIAIILFPGLNTEYETRREINRAGMRGEFFRWNEPVEKLAKYDGYVIGGGFSYEDRGRAGVIAALDPIMQVIKGQAALGKPVLGICNGAQILVETGLVPGVEGGAVAISLARNKRMKEGKVLGTGYYNTWTHLKTTAPAKSCMFTWNLKEGEMLEAPIAHGEGRFTTDTPDLMLELRNRGQMVFRYATAEGVIVDEFPTNPNGAAFNAAAICNPEGNVMAVMPHLERDHKASHLLFTSMRDAMLARKKSSSESGTKRRVTKLIIPAPKRGLPPPYKANAKSFAIISRLKINDNEAETFEMAAHRMGFDGLKLKRATHIEIGYEGKPDLEKLGKKLVTSGALLNTNKEVAELSFQTSLLKKITAKFSAKNTKEAVATTTSYQLLVRERDDFVGLSKLATLKNRLKISDIASVHLGTLWRINLPTKNKTLAETTLKKLLATNLFFNPHRQSAYLLV